MPLIIVSFSLSGTVRRIIGYSSGYSFPNGDGGVYTDSAGIFPLEMPVLQIMLDYLRCSSIIFWGKSMGTKTFRFSIPGKGRDAVGSILWIEAPHLFEGGPVPFRQLLRNRRLNCNDYWAFAVFPFCICRIDKSREMV